MEQQKHSIRVYQFFRSVLALFCAVVILITAVPATVARAEDADDSYDLEAVANSLGTILSIGSTPTKEGIKGVTPIGGLTYDDGSGASRCGKAGLVLAYTSKPTSIGQWIAAKMSMSSMSYDYGSIMKIADGKGGSSTAVYQYAVYGRALSELGLDKTEYALSGGKKISNIIRGYGTLIVYLFASGVNGMFSFAIKVLQLLNPFGWLDNVARDTTVAAGAQYSTVATTGKAFAGIHTLSRYIAGIYSTMCNLSWGFVIPMMLAFYLAGMFLFKKTSGGKRLLKRILFIAIGIPLIGSTYTSFLYNMGDMFQNGSSYADKVIASTFVDFESWVVSSHLAPPEVNGKRTSIQVRVPVDKDGNKLSGSATAQMSLGGELSDNTTYDIKELCLAINKESNNLDVDDSSIRDGLTFETTDATFDGSVADGADINLNETATSEDEIAKDLGVTDDSNKIKKAVIKQNKNNANSSREWAVNMLKRYASGETYTSEQFASAIQSRMTELSLGDGTLVTEGGGATGESAPDNSGKAAVIIDKMMHATSTYSNFQTYASEGNSLLGTIASVFSSRPNDDSYKLEDSNEKIAVSDYPLFKSNGINYSIFNDGALKCELSNDSGATLYTYSIYSSNDADKKVTSPYVRDKNGNWYDGRTETPNVGLSTMSMYNYLNSSFDSTKVVVYGGGNVISNGLIKRSHMSVNIIGTGMMATVYWASAICLLICITVIGFTYSIGMMKGCIKYMLRTIMAMPLAMVGSLRHIAKFCATVIGMIASILVTALMYGVCIEVLMAIADILTNSIALSTVVVGMGIMAATMFAYLFAIIILIIITIVCMRIRKQTVNSITEWLTQVIGKFFEADGHNNPDKPKNQILGQVAGGLAAGVASGVAGAAMTKGAAAIAGGLGGNGGGSDPNDPKDPPDGPPNDGGGGGALPTATGSTIEQEERLGIEQKPTDKEQTPKDGSTQTASVDLPEGTTQQTDPTDPQGGVQTPTTDTTQATDPSTENAEQQEKTPATAESALEEAAKKDPTGIAGIAYKNAKAAKDMKNDLQNGNVKDAVKHGASAAAADAALLGGVDSRSANAIGDGIDKIAGNGNAGNAENPDGGSNESVTKGVTGGSDDPNTTDGTSGGTNSGTGGGSSGTGYDAGGGNEQSGGEEYTSGGGQSTVPPIPTGTTNPTKPTAFSEDSTKELNALNKPDVQRKSLDPQNGSGGTTNGGQTQNKLKQVKPQGKPGGKRKVSSNPPQLRKPQQKDGNQRPERKGNDQQQKRETKPAADGKQRKPQQKPETPPAKSAVPPVIIQSKKGKPESEHHDEPSVKNLNKDDIPEPFDKLLDE